MGKVNINKFFQSEAACKNHKSDDESEDSDGSYESSFIDNDGTN